MDMQLAKPQQSPKGARCESELVDPHGSSFNSRKNHSDGSRRNITWTGEEGKRERTRTRKAGRWYRCAVAIIVTDTAAVVTVAGNDHLQLI